MSDAATLTPAVAQPSHVPDAVVYDFDMFNDPALRADPHERVRDLVKNAPPIFWTPRNGGHWMFLSHAANFQGSRDYEKFSNEVIPRALIKQYMASLPEGSPHIPQPLPITVDPPEHTAYRAPLQTAFSPKAMLALKDDIRALAVSLIEEMKPNGRSEVVADLAEPLPVQVFLTMFGLPVERQREYRDLVVEHFSSSNSADTSQMVARLHRLTAIMRPTLLERRDDPRDDLISQLWKAGIGGKPTTLEDMENYCVVLFTAGLDTVVNGIGLAVRHLAADPYLQAKLRAEPKLIPEAAEEMLRRYTFTVPPRRSAKDQVFEGVELRKDDKIMLFLPAADLDPEEFPNPESYDLDRENNVHIAFGTGPHRCLGSHLARIELQVVYEELLSRLPAFRLDPDRPATFHGGHVVGPERLSIVWDA